MKPERYNAVDRWNLELTEEEIKEGWFFCNCEWDGMLIHKDWSEAEVCSCHKEKNK